MIVKFSTILSDTIRTIELTPFTPECESLSKVPIIDVAMQYDHPSIGQIIVLIVKNGLHVPSMDLNLIPTFVLSEAG